MKDYGYQLESKKKNLLFDKTVQLLLNGPLGLVKEDLQETFQTDVLVLGIVY